MGMFSALLAVAVWLTFASGFGWPVPTTHTIVGAIIGFAVVATGIEAVHWWGVAAIAVSWLITPILAGVISFSLVLSVPRLIFDRNDPAFYARRQFPVHIVAVASRLVIDRLRFRSFESPIGGQTRFNDVERVFGVLMIANCGYSEQGTTCSGMIKWNAIWFGESSRRCLAIRFRTRKLS